MGFLAMLFPKRRDNRDVIRADAIADERLASAIQDYTASVDKLEKSTQEQAASLVQVNECLAELVAYMEQKR